uniref:Uncharacterized protein n=1 Tax=Salix viminalis TaxID=40686 RepID=A0A6N2NFU0_SALVM
MVARTTIRTKLYEALADQLTDIVVNSLCFTCLYGCSVFESLRKPLIYL